MLPTAQPKRFTVAEYHRLAELGFLSEVDHIELIRGELIQMAAKGVAHETCMTRLLRILAALVGELVTLRCQSPITLSFDGEPEPDFSLLRNREDDYTTAHPTPKDVLLVIEVADSSLNFDREVKLPLYAQAGIPDYWLFNLQERCLEVYSEPAQLTDNRFGYLNRRIVTVTGAVALPFVSEQLLVLEQVFSPLISMA